MALQLPGPIADGGTLLHGRVTAPEIRPRHLLHVLPSFALGGVQVRLARLIGALGHRYRHTVLALDGNLAASAILDPAVDVDVEAVKHLPKHPPASLFAVRRRIRAEMPDLLCTYNWGAIDWAMGARFFSRCNHVHFEDGFGPDEIEHRLKRRAFLRRLALGKARHVIVPSHTLETIALSEWHLAPDHVRYIPNGIDADAFAATSHGAKPLFARAANETIIGTVAPLRPEKNVGRLIRAFAAMNSTVSTRLVIAGGGAQRDELGALAQSLGVADRVLFLGAINEPGRALAQFDIFALSSNTEQMPMCVLEAMAMALPIVSVDVGDVKHMLAPANRALTVPTANEAGFASALDTLVTEPNRRAELGRLNQRHVRETYPWQVMVDTYDRVFSER